MSIRRAVIHPNSVDSMLDSRMGGKGCKLEEKSPAARLSHAPIAKMVEFWHCSHHDAKGVFA